MNAQYYDHALNHRCAAEASAVARVRREAIAEGNAYRVEFSNSKGERFYWEGGRYDALGLAKSLRFNGGEVSLTNPKGEAVNIENARY